MSRYLSLLFRVGGPIRRRDVRVLYALLNGYSRDHDFQPSGRDAVAEFSRMCDDDGVFDFLTMGGLGDTFDDAAAFCEEVGIAYDLHAGNNYPATALAGTVIRFRPGLGKDGPRPTRPFGGPIAVDRRELLAILSAYKRAAGRMLECDGSELDGGFARMARQVLSEVAEVLGSDIPDLGPLRIFDNEEEATDGRGAEAEGPPRAAG